MEESGTVRKIEIFEFTVELPEGMSIPSVNKHKEVAKAGHRYKNTRVRKYQEEVTKQVKKSSLIDLGSLESPVLKVEFKFIFKNRYWNRDVSNMFKATEDALKDAIGVDDSRTVYITGEKVKHEEKAEKIEIRVEVLEDGTFPK